MSETKKLNLDDVSNSLKCGWIEHLDNDEIICRLQRDYELDHVLTLGRGLLTPEQDKMVKLGLIVRYDFDKGTIELMLKDGINWC